MHAAHTPPQLLLLRRTPFFILFGYMVARTFRVYSFFPLETLGRPIIRSTANARTPGSTYVRNHLCAILFLNLFERFQISALTSRHAESYWDRVLVEGASSTCCSLRRRARVSADTVRRRCPQTRPKGRCLRFAPPLEF